MQKLNEYQQRDYDNMVTFAGELSAFYPSEVIAHDDNFIVVLTRGSRTYQVRKNYDGTIQVWEYPYARYNHVSSSTRAEVYKKHETQNMRVLSQKKLDAKLDAVDLIQTELQELESRATSAKASFLQQLEASGLPVSYHYDYSTDWVDGEMVRTQGAITGGSIVKNGIEFTFSFSQDGYISRKVEVHYSVENTLEAFVALSNNEYKA